MASSRNFDDPSDLSGAGSGAIDRKKFLCGAAAVGLGAWSYPRLVLGSETVPVEGPRFDPEKLGTLAGEEYWEMIRSNFDVPDFSNLENGYFSPMAASTRRFHEREIERVNRLASFYLRRQAEEEGAQTKAALADFAGCSPDELVIVRNTTEATDTVIMGLDWKSGDEVVTSDQDYASMTAQFHQASARWGIVIRVASVPLHPQSDEEIVEAYVGCIGPRTKLLLLTHLLNISGQALPAAKIIDAAHERGVEVLVDGAHSFAHLDFRISDLRCDYFGTSLHKWLGAPLGLGLLFVRRDKIGKLWPLLGDDRSRSETVAKLEHLGTRPVHAVKTIEEAIRFHRTVGSARKLARLRFLKNYWTRRVAEVPGVEILSTLEEQRGGAIACFAKKGRTPSQIAQFLWDRHKVFSVAIEGGRVQGVRITPHLYITPRDLDRLVAGIAEC